MATFEKGSIPCIWADPYWKYPNEFLREVSKDVVVSPWYYDTPYGEAVDIHGTKPIMKDSITELPQNGYLTMPCASNWLIADHVNQLVKYTKENVSSKNLFGVMIAPWVFTLEEHKYTIFESIQLLKNARDKYFIGQQF